MPSIEFNFIYPASATNHNGLWAPYRRINSINSPQKCECIRNVVLFHNTLIYIICVRLITLATLTRSLNLKIILELERSRQNPVPRYTKEKGIIYVATEAKTDKYCHYYNAELALTGGSTSDEFVCCTLFKNRINTTCELFNMRVEDMKTWGATQSQKSEKNRVTPRLHTIVLDSGSRLPTRPNNNVVLRIHMTTDPLDDGLSP